MMQVSPMPLVFYRCCLVYYQWCCHSLIINMFNLSTLCIILLCTWGHMVEYSTPSASFTQSSLQKGGILTWAVTDPEGVPWVPWNPSCEGLPWKYYAQMYYIHYPHTRATHFSFTVAITHVSQLNNFLVSRIWCAHDLRACIYYQKHVAIIETMSGLKQRFYSCIAPSAARDGVMLSVWECLFLCLMWITSCFAFDSAGSKHIN